MQLLVRNAQKITPLFAYMNVCCHVAAALADTLLFAIQRRSKEITFATMCTEITNKDLELNVKFALRALATATTKLFSPLAIYAIVGRIFGRRPQNRNNPNTSKSTNKTNQMTTILKSLLFTHQITIYSNTFINRQVNGQYEREPPHWTRDQYIQMIMS